VRWRNHPGWRLPRTLVRVRSRTVLASFVAVTVLVTVAVYAVWQRVSKDLPLRLPTSRECMVATGGELRVDLNAEQMANAATISAVAIRRGLPRYAVVVALATAWQESKLFNLAGGDRDSIGLFQQRPSQGWGSPEKLNDPRYAAGAFYTSLLKVPGWQEMRVTDAAQAVQRSAHPELYEQWADDAEIMAQALTGEVAGAVHCTLDIEPSGDGTAAAQGLAAALKLDWGSNVRAAVEPAVVGVTVRNDKAGWQYAHWLVSHAADHRVRKVRFGSQEWTARSGSWAKSSEPPNGGGGERVVAELSSS